MQANRATKRENRGDATGIADHGARLIAACLMSIHKAATHSTHARETRDFTVASMVGQFLAAKPVRVAQRKNKARAWPKVRPTWL